jgi:hypothetical protein
MVNACLDFAIANAVELVGDDLGVLNYGLQAM